MKLLTMDLREKNKLLLARAGFGISLDGYAHPKPIKELVGSLFPATAAGDLEMLTEEDWMENNPKAMKAIGDDAERKEKQKEFRDKTKDINVLWMQEMMETQYPLLEKTALMWHGHFATRFDNPYFDQKLMNVFRKNALGNFGTLLREVSKSPAMLQFLNNRQNKKKHPNENFAREVMELFTLGRGNYSETDVKEAARAFTGWTFDEYGNFLLKEKQHDDGVKTFLGKTGQFDGDDIIDLLLAQKQTARFITGKVYRYYVSDNEPDEKHIEELANAFYKNNYDITALLKGIFTAEWFYARQVQGAKVKSPVELLVGYARMLPMNFGNEQVLVNLQRVLGQYLFNPPNVAGWPGGRDWIDSSSLVVRMRLPEAFFMSRELNLSAKESDPEMGSMNKMAQQGKTENTRQFHVGKVETDWTAYYDYWKQYDKKDLPDALAGYLLPYPAGKQKLADIATFADVLTHENYVKSLSILLMELPEYQLC